MAKRIIVNVIPEEIRMALSEDGKLLEVAVERTESDYMVGNIYKGRVENVLPGMQAAFINIGIGKNAFLYAGDIFPHKSFQRLVEEDNLTVGAEIMVEIVKDAMGTKGPRATTHFSIPGRYVVVMPSVDYVGVSRRIESGEERARLRSLAEKIRPKGMGVIVRTVAEGHSEEELARDFQYLSNLWGALTAKAKRAKAPFLLYRDADLVIRIIRDHVKDDIDEVFIDNAEAHARMVELAKFISPDLVKKIHLYKAKTEIFAHYGIEDEWNRLADRRVDLKCGGYLIIDKTEALTVIDVNTGRFIGHSNLADTVFRTNMEAAAEIARQLRLRDIGGIIVADFIDMQKDVHKKAILAELEARLKADNTKTNVLGLTELGLVEMTRKKARQTYEGTLYEGCPCCGGRGIIQTPDTLEITIRRQLRRIAAKRPGADLVVQMHPRIAERFEGKKVVAALESEMGIDLTVESVEGMQPEVYAIFEGDKALVRSNEPKKVRKHAPRCEIENGGESGAELEPLTDEELAPLLAERFAMENVMEPAGTFESRLAAMTGSLWEPLLEEEDEVAAAFSPEAGKSEDSMGAPEVKKPRRRRRSKKMLPPSASELPSGKPTIGELPSEPEVPAAEAAALPAETTAKKSRRRRKTKKDTDEITEMPNQEEAYDTVAGAEQIDATEPDLETHDASEMSSDAATKKPKRKRRRRKKPTTEAGPMSEPADIQEAASISVADIAQAVEEPGESAEIPGKKTKRRRRKKKKPASETAELMEGFTAVGSAEPESIPAFEPESIDGDETPVKKSRRRRRKKKPANPESVLDEKEFAPTIEPSEKPGSIAADGQAAVSPESAAASVKKKRRRRRSNGKKKPPEGGESSGASPVEPD